MKIEIFDYFNEIKSFTKIGMKIEIVNCFFFFTKLQILPEWKFFKYIVGNQDLLQFQL